MEKWKDINIKDKIAIVSAIVAFCAGWALSIAAFLVPPVGEIHESILWILGQSLIYAASVFGVASYFTSETVRLRHDMRKILKDYEDERTLADSTAN